MSAVLYPAQNPFPLAPRALVVTFGVSILSPALPTMQSAYGSVSAPHANRPPTAFWTILGLACASVVVGAAIGSALSPVAHTSTLYATSTSRPTLARATPALVGTARPYSAPASVAHASVHSARDGSAMEHASAAARERLQERPGLTNAGWLSILTGLVVGAVVYLRRSARPAAPQEPFVCCAATGQQEKEEEDVEMMRGMRWDGANLRWVKDDMAEVRVKYVPETGAAYTLWPVVHTRLTEVGLKSVSPKKALEMMKGGLFGRKAVLLDIRVAKDYSRGRAAGSVSVPLFGPVRGTGMMDNIKRLAMAGFAMEVADPSRVKCAPPPPVEESHDPPSGLLKDFDSPF